MSANDTKLVDLEATQDFDIRWTETKDLATIEGGAVVVQNAVLRSYGAMMSLFGEPADATAVERVRGRLETIIRRQQYGQFEGLRVTEYKPDEGRIAFAVELATTDDIEFAVVSSSFEYTKS